MFKGPNKRMKRDYENLFVKMLTSKMAEKEWIMKSKLPDAPKDIVILRFFLRNHPDEFVKSHSYILKDLIDKIIDNDLGLNEFSNSTYCFTLIGKGYFKRKNYFMALENFLQAVNLDESNVIAHCYCGISYFMQENYESTCLHFAKAILHQRPKDYPYFTRKMDLVDLKKLASFAERKGDQLNRQGNLVEAEAYYSLAKKGVPKTEHVKHALILKTRGAIRVKLKKLLEADWDFNRGIKLLNEVKYLDQPALISSLYYYLGKVNFKRGRIDLAMNNFILALTHLVNDDELKGRILLKKVLCYEKQKKFSDSVNDLKELLKIYPEDDTIRSKLFKLESKLRLPTNNASLKHGRSIEEGEVHSEGAEPQFKKPRISPPESRPSPSLATDSPLFNTTFNQRRNDLLPSEIHEWQSIPSSSKSTV